MRSSQYGIPLPTDGVPSLYGSPKVACPHPYDVHSPLMACARPAARALTSIARRAWLQPVACVPSPPRAQAFRLPSMACLSHPLWPTFLMASLHPSTVCDHPQTAPACGYAIAYLLHGMPLPTHSPCSTGTHDLCSLAPTMGCRPPPMAMPSIGCLH
jgi:hypothetical protein